MKKTDVVHDQFFTKKSVAKSCLLHLKQFIGDDLFFVEPSAGSGNFLNLLPRDSRLGIDIAKGS